MFSNKRSRKGATLPCIFVHAGAGYHSEQNESIHLSACNDAAAAAMAVLRSGGVAADAVETAIRILEDSEITNAGYGSNLALDGVVECDAVVVDHFGRSGACGAVAQIKNPISLARMILDRTTETLSLRRVPPNLLVGQGATDFAAEFSIPVLEHKSLISRSAKERWIRWKLELQASKRSDKNGVNLPYIPPVGRAFQDEQSRHEHTKKMEDKVRAAARGRTPPASTNNTAASNVRSSSVPSTIMTTPSTPPPTEPTSYATNGKHQAIWARAESLAHESDDAVQLPLTGRNDDVMAVTAPHVEVEMSDVDDEDHESMSRVLVEPLDDGGHQSDSSSTGTSLELPSLIPSPVNRVRSFDGASPSLHAPQEEPPSGHEREDSITDTVGAIAIDVYGNIACGASSGGIGMKHRGRIGPAALVGVGAAVVPVDADDRNQTCVAVVASGTGEHMATTMAATTFAERLYAGVKKVKGGLLAECENDDEVIRAVVEKEFMGHPSVKQSHSNGAIGVLCVKKTKDGINLYYAHNTDSFALASQSADDVAPVCTMSRNKGNGVTAIGGRSMRPRRK